MISAYHVSMIPLERALRRVVDLCRDLKEVLREEQSILVGNEKGELAWLLERKEGMIKRMRQAEAHLIKVFQNVIKLRHFEGGEPSLSEFIKVSKDPFADRLRLAQGELVEVLHSVFSLNRQNESLIRHALYYNHSFLGLMRDFVDRDNDLTYNLEGKVQPNIIRLLGKRA